MQLKVIPEDFIVEELQFVESLIKANPAEKSARFTYFLLTKRNRTTLECIYELSERLRISPKSFGIAGLKDKCAITTQAFSVKDISPDALARITMRDVHLEVLGKGTKEIYRGQHAGNSFCITVRDITKVPLQDCRFVNLFGEQRFSTKNVTIGKFLVKRQWKDAAFSCDAISVKEYLHYNPTDFIGSIRTVDIKILQLYVQSYSSFLWNTAAQLHVKRNHVSGENNSENSLSLPGFAMEHECCIDEVMQHDKVNASDFLIREIPEVSCEGADRTVKIDVQNLTIGSLEDDELHVGKKKIVVKFILPPGSYATVFLKTLFGQLPQSGNEE